MSKEIEITEDQVKAFKAAGLEITTRYFYNPDSGTPAKRNRIPLETPLALVPSKRSVLLGKNVRGEKRRLYAASVETIFKDAKGRVVTRKSLQDRMVRLHGVEQKEISWYISYMIRVGFLKTMEK
jgi:hypothetical protein